MHNKFVEVIEGKITILIPPIIEKTKKMLVFYNPEKKFDRDLSILLLKILLKNKTNVKICDALAATGIRGLRYASELPNASVVYINDIKKFAYDVIKINVLRNRNLINACIIIRNFDANLLFTSHVSFFDVIDIDPFGTPRPFLENAILSLKNNGILLVTATDTAPLSGSYPLTCKRRYGSKTCKCEFYPEMAIRILAKSVIEIGAQYDFALIPLFAYWKKDYVRLVFKKIRNAKKSDILVKQLGFIAYCRNCLFREKFYDFVHITDCPYCKSSLCMIGPLFLGNLWNHDLIEQLLNEKTIDKKTSIWLEKIIHESAIDIPYFYTTDTLSHIVKVNEPKFIELITALRLTGCAVSPVHSNPKGFKTTCSLTKIKETLKKIV